MASRGYGPDFGPLLQALQSYAGQETSQANSRFDASSQLASTALSATTNIRKWKKEDEEEEILNRTMMDTPDGPTSARQLAALSGASAVVQSMVLSAAALSELKSGQDNAAAVKLLRAGMTPHIGPADDPVAGLARPSTMVPGAVAQPAANPPADMSAPLVPPEPRRESPINASNWKWGPKPKASKPPAPDYTEYVTRDGEDIFDVSQRFGINPRRLMDENKLAGTRVPRGARLRIPNLR